MKKSGSLGAEKLRLATFTAKQAQTVAYVFVRACLGLFVEPCYTCFSAPRRLLHVFFRALPSLLLCVKIGFLANLFFCAQMVARFFPRLVNFMCSDFLSKNFKFPAPSFRHFDRKKTALNFLINFNARRIINISTKIIM